MSQEMCTDNAYVDWYHTVSCTRNSCLQAGCSDCANKFTELLRLPYQCQTDVWLCQPHSWYQLAQNLFWQVTS